MAQAQVWLLSEFQDKEISPLTEQCFCKKGNGPMPDGDGLNYNRVRDKEKHLAIEKMHGYSSLRKDRNNLKESNDGSEEVSEHTLKVKEGNCKRT